jgi:Uncharacterised nucleotidyltransferase
VLSPLARARLAALSRDLDWDVVLDEAGRHAMIPLVHHHADVLQPPPPALHRLERELAGVVRRTLTLTNALVEALATLRATGIGATAFKGPALAMAAYDSLVLRQFNTLDLLIHRADLAAAERALARCGYREAQASPARAWVRGDVVLVLHWGLAPRWVGTAGMAGVWVRRRPIQLGETRVAAPSPEDHLILLILHAAQRMWGRVGWLADVAALLDRHPRLDHGAVRYEARRHGIERLVRLGLGLAHALVEAPLPREVTAWTHRDRGIEDLVRDVCIRRLRPAATPPGVFEAARFHLRSRERWRDRMRDATHGAGAILALPARIAARATSGLRERSRRAMPVIPAFHR